MSDRKKEHSVPKRGHSLRNLIFLYGGIILAVLSLAYLLVTNSIMGWMLLDMESEHVESHLSMMTSFLKNSEGNLYLIAEDNGVWDETVRFARGENPGYIAKNWPDTSVLDAYNVDFFLVQDAQGRVCHQEISNDIVTRRGGAPGALLQELEGVVEAVLAQYAQAAVPPEQLGKSGVLLVGNMPYLVAVVPVLETEHSLEPAGSIAFAKHIDEDFFRGNNIATQFSFSPYDGKAPLGIIVTDAAHGLLCARTVVHGVDGAQIQMEIHNDNELYLQGQSDIRHALILVFLLLVGALLAIAIGVHRVLHPLDQLVADMGEIKMGDLLEVGRYAGTQELTTISMSVNGMLERLNQSQVSLETLQSILDGMDAYVFVSDLQTDELLFVNQKLIEHFGLQGDVTGQKCWKVMQVNTNPQHRCSDCPAIQLLRGGEDTVTWEHRNPDTGHYYRKTDCLIDWSNGRKVHLQCGVDITEQKQAEEFLKMRLAQQELMSAISKSFLSADPENILIENALQLAGEKLDASRLILVEADEKAGMIYWKYGWFGGKGNIRQQTTTVSFPMVKGNIMYDSFVAQNLPYVACRDTAEMPALQGEIFGVKSCLIVPLHHSGRFWGSLCIDDCYSCRSWDDSDIYFVQLLGNVILELIFREQTNAELQRMSSIVDSSPLSISYIGEGGTLEYVNQGTLDLSGYSAEELQERDVYVLFDEPTGRRIREEILGQVLSGERQSFELPMVRKDGEVRQLLISVFSIRSESQGLGVIATDITEMRKLEQELIQAKEQAERSNRAKSEFLSRMSHEMRTPMNAIIGMTSIAKTSETLQRKDYCLDKIDNASSHLLGVINDILDMSKIEAGKFELSCTDFSLRKMLTRVVNVVGFRMEEKDLQFRVHVAPDVPGAIVSDEQRLAQVITNLLSNAMKFTPEKGHIQLDIRQIERQGNACELEIAVADSGIGITPEQQQRLFRSFEQADGSTSRKYGGTGLGLAISKTIIELMGGRIWVESEEGKGSRFVFRIRTELGHTPSAPEDEAVFEDADVTADLADQLGTVDQVESTSDASQDRDSVDDIFAGKRLLLAEDVAINQEILIALLEPTGIAVDTADDGRQVCEKFQQNPDIYDLIFMDIHMPEVDGYEATRRIRALDVERAGTIPIVAMTANVFREDIERCLDAGMNSHVGKPLDLEEVLDVLRKFLL